MIYFIVMFCSLNGIIKWVKHHFLPCSTHIRPSMSSSYFLVCSKINMWFQFWGVEFSWYIRPIWDCLDKPDIFFYQLLRLWLFCFLNPPPIFSLEWAAVYWITQHGQLNKLALITAVNKSSFYLFRLSLL